LKSIQVFRDFYANFVVNVGGSSDESLIGAFASVEREHYVGVGPWQIWAGSGYLSTVSDDPCLLYQDVLVGLATDRGLNNGQPSLHARSFAACLPVDGETVVHVGAGTGYYTAILAALVGPAGRVIGYEIEPDLAARAKDCLAHLANTEVICASAVGVSLPKSDVVYVNAGATHPVEAWLDSLNIGGRLLFPLTGDRGIGVMLLLKRTGDSTYSARIFSKAGFVNCIGARDDVACAALTAALEVQATSSVKSLRRDSRPDETAWCVGTGWWLSTAEAT
jgi:protein-L-isoaspartate(D-aspartate) O-methyltransferase